MKIKSINPSTYQVLGRVEQDTKKDIARAVQTARKAQPNWQTLSQVERNKKVKSLVELIDENRDEISKIVSKEMGKPIKESRAQIDDAIAYFNAFIDMAEVALKPEVVFENETERHTILHESLGVIVCITPWNFPILNIPWQAGQALIAGNAVLYKPSEETILFAQLIKKLVEQSDIPEGVFSVVLGDGSVGEELVKQPVNAILFTGSTKTSKRITKLASENSTKVLTELGGSAPGIVFEDADIPKIIDTLYFWRYSNAGQFCDGLKRLIVHESKQEELINALQKINKTKVVGNAMDEATDIGPLVAKRQLELLQEQVKDAVDKGARVEFGGEKPKELNGAFYAPTLLSNVSFDMKVWKEEVFGPVLPIVAFKDEQEAIRLGNDTIYGLGAFIFTEDKKRYWRVAKKIQSGVIAHNNALYFSFWSPFGGYKQSGNSRVGGKEGFLEVTQTKLISQEK